MGVHINTVIRNEQITYIYVHIFICCILLSKQAKDSQKIKIKK